MTAAATAPRIPDQAADLSPSERAAAGKAARERAPRSSHGDWEPAADRPDPVDVLERQAADRVPELVPLRYGRMLVSPFTFYRGAAAIMAADLAATPSSGLWVQACGDAHLSNFGGYAVAGPRPGRRHQRLRRDPPRAMGVGRQAARRQLRDRRPRPRVQRRASGATSCSPSVAAYRENMRRLAELSNLDVWYRRVDVEQIRERFQDEAQQQGAQAASTATSPRPVARTGCARSRSSPSGSTASCGSEAIPPCSSRWRRCSPARSSETAEARVGAVLADYRETLLPDRRHLLDGYRLVHAARKVVGVGSVGTRAWIALLIGRDENDPLFLQIKEAQPSVLEPYTAPTEFDEQGQRVVEGQRLTQAASDIFLGWLSANGPDGKKRDFYVRQLWDQKASADGRADVAGGDDRLRPGLRRRSSRAPTPAPATGSRSPPTSAAEAASTRRSRTSPTPTPTRTRTTSRR